ncbi:RHS repeat-associated core domain-containing protein [Nakamurella panacisegetis]|uniref:RHS repeat-associated core domain-containing protein n=1 Tax=Nakamurella panacisegetis TaxID=1090615 RepID=A0A1H0LET7_9ACTN|nr:RHS repeat-associated core domain-containing protein [Nakamurella panacisegetis]SDO66699.1 RHS repeat-associated core domain-containing protein [Nakamurella panacisegetis]
MDSQTFANPDGTTSKLTYARQVFVKNPAGALVPVDESLRLTGGRWATGPSGAPASFAALADDVKLASLAVGGGVLSYGVDGASAAKVDSSTGAAVYSGILPDVDLVARPTASGIKESIILNAATAQQQFSFPLSVPAGVTPVVTTRGSVEFRRADGSLVATIPAGYMFDSTRGVHSGLPAGSWGVTYTITRTGAGWSLGVALDRKWLLDPARKFPVTVDPSVTVKDDEDDTWIQEGSSNSHAGPGPSSLSGAEQYLAVGPVPPDGGSGEATISLLHIPLSSLAGQTISSAQLELDEVWSSSCTPEEVDIQAVAEGSANAWTGSTVVWPGPALAPTVLASQTVAHGWDDGSGTSPCKDPAAVKFSLDPAQVASWANNPSTYNGFAVTYPSGASSDSWKKFASYDGNIDNAPHLVITYATENATYNATTLTLPSPAATGSVNVDVTNTGSTDWAAGAGYKLSYSIKDSAGNPAGAAVTPVAVTAAAGAVGHVVLPIPKLGHGTYTITVDMQRPDGTSFHTADGTPLGTISFTVPDAAPVINLTAPNGETSVLSPTLFIGASDPDDATSTLLYDFKVCPAATPTTCTDSGWISKNTYQVANNAVPWGATALWSASVKDPTGTVATMAWMQFHTLIPQPWNALRLGTQPTGVTTPGVDPATGNYTTSATDVTVNGAGPSVNVTRTYNSLDTGIHAFGAGWSNLVDSHLAVDADGSGNIVTSDGSGTAARWGKLADGTFSPPQGRTERLVANANGTYSLADSGGSIRTFSATGNLTSITDAAGHQIALTYTGTHVTRIQNSTSGRGITYTWTGSHVTAVTTDPVTTGGTGLTWSYTYSGDTLTAVCSPLPGTPCTTYAYTSGNQFPNAVRDGAPMDYWRLDGSNRDTGQDPTGVATNSAAVGGVTFNAADTPLTQSTAPTALFNGTSGYLTLGTLALSKYVGQTVQVWFNTSTAGVILSAQDQPVSGSTPTASDPILYVGTDGKLHAGEQQAAGVTPSTITTTAAVTDNTWHLATLVVGGGRQTLYVDGQAAGTAVGATDLTGLTYVSVGAGTSTGAAAAPAGQGFFSGRMSDFALFATPLTSGQITAEYAARTPVPMLSTVTLPQSNRQFAAITYDTAEPRVATLVDHNGATSTVTYPNGVGGGSELAKISTTATTPANSVNYYFDMSRGGQIISRVDPHGTQSWAYDTSGLLLATTDADGLTTQYVYDSHGNPIQTSVRPPNSVLTTINYATYYWNASNPLDPRNGTKLTTSDGRATSASDATYKVSNAIDAIGDVLTTTYPTPSGQTAAPVVSNTYSAGTEAAADTGTIPKYLLLKTVGARNQVTSYQYLHNGDLYQVTSPSGLITRYTYDGLGRKTSTSTYNGSTLIGTSTYTFDAVNDLTSTTTAKTTDAVTGSQHQLVSSTTYDNDGNPLVVTAHDAIGSDPDRITTNTYNSHDQLASTTNPAGLVTTYTYTGGGDLATSTAPDGIVTTTTYDDRHLPTSTTLTGTGVDPQDPTASGLITGVKQYDPAGLLANQTDAAGNQKVYTYTPFELLATVTAKNVANAAGATHDIVLESDTYDTAGHLTAQTASGVSAVATYDPAGNVASTTLDPSGIKRVTTNSFDADSHAVTVTRTGATSSGRTETTTYTYDDAGQVLTAAKHGASSNQTTTVVRDVRELVTSSTDPAGAVSTYTYDALGQRTTAAAPSITTFRNSTTATTTPTSQSGYDSFGDTTEIKDPDGNITTTAYNTSGQPTTVTAPTYTPVGGSPLVSVTTTGYDDMGRASTYTDAAGRVTTLTYNPQGSAITKTDPAVGTNPAGVSTNSFDRDGNLIQSVNQVGVTTKATYDGLGRQLTATAVERSATIAGTSFPQVNYTTTNTYDDAGNLTAQTTPEGKTSTGTYDAAGDQLTFVDPAGHTTTNTYDLAGRTVTTTNPDGIVTTNTYNLVGALTATAVAHGNTTATTGITYDAKSRPTTITSPAGRITNQAYDADDNLTLVTQHPTSTTTTTVAYGYDPAGNRTKFTDGNGNITTTTYTPWNQPETVTEPATTADPTDRNFVTKYNILGQVSGTTSPGGISTTNTYDALGDLTGQSGSGATASTTARTFGFDLSGRMTSFSTPGGTETTTYNDRGQLQTTAGPAGNSSYVYNGDGTINQKIGAASTQQFTYDNADRLATAFDPINQITLTLTTTAAGLPTGYTTKTTANATAEKVTATYDSLDRMSGLSAINFAGGTTTAATYGYDLDNNLTSKTENGKANTYGYDNASRLTSWAVTGGATTTYSYDPAGNRTAVNSVTSTYNQRNQLVSDSSGNTSTYDNAGDLIASKTGGVTTASTFDAFGQQATDGASTFTYDALGRANSRTVTTPASTTALTYDDLSNNLAGTGTATVEYLPDGTPIAEKSPAGVAQMLLANPHGDIIDSYTRAGSTVSSRTFDPWGTVTATTGTEQPVVGYQGGYTDPTTGDVNANARWYKPAKGTFNSRDTTTNTAPPTAATNRYTYGNNNPLTYNDTNGHWSVCDLGLCTMPSLNPGALNGVISGGTAAATIASEEETGGALCLGVALESLGVGCAAVETGTQVVAGITALVNIFSSSGGSSDGGSSSGDATSWDSSKWSNHNGVYNSDAGTGNDAPQQIGCQSQGYCPRTGDDGLQQMGCQSQGYCPPPDYGPVLDDRCSSGFCGGPFPTYTGPDGGGAGTSDGGGDGGTGGPGSSANDAASAALTIRKAAQWAHVLANIAHTLDWDDPTSTPITKPHQPTTRAADNNLVVKASNNGAVPTKKPTGCAATCENDPTQTAGSAVQPINTTLDNSCHTGGQTRPDNTSAANIWTCGGAGTAPNTLKLPPEESWANAKTLDDHYSRHGADFGATSPADYANQASEFFQRGLQGSLPTKISSDGTIRIYDPSTNSFGSYGPGGMTKTYFKPTSSDYWSRQPGVLQ